MKLLLSFDVEEFDDFNISKKDEFSISHSGLIKVLRLLDGLSYCATFFVSYSFAKRYKKLIKKMSLKHEIASHGYEHSDDYSKMSNSEIYLNLKRAKLGVEKIIGKKIIGFRAPRLQKVDYGLLARLGFKYDSSLNPTFIPGRYNNFFSKRKCFVKDDIKVFPGSVVPIFRVPLFWLSFRNFGSLLSLLLSELCLIGVGYVNLFFHSWEFVDLSKLRIPFLIKRNTGSRLIRMLEKFIIDGGFKVMRFDKFLNSKLL